MNIYAKTVKHGRIAATVRWGVLNPKSGFISAWDAARTAYDGVHGVGAFNALPTIDFGNARPSQNQAVREYLREVA